MIAPRLAAFCLTVGAIAAHAAPHPPGFHVIDRIAGPDGGWDYVSYDQARDRVLIPRTNFVNAVDLKTRTVKVEFAPAAWGHAAFAVKDGSEVVITNGAKGAATFVDAATGAALASVATGKAPDDAIVDPKSGLLLVMNHAGGDVSLIDLKTHTVVATILVGGVLEAAAVDGKGRAFVNVENKNQIAVLDITGRKVTARYELPGCEGPTGIAYAPADKLLISSCDGVAMVVAAESGKIVRKIPIGDGADGVAFDLGRKLAFIPAGHDGTLAVISVAHGDATLLETVPTQRGARTLTLDPVNGRVFLPTARYGTPTAPGARPPVIPGSFELLIVGK